MGWARWEGPDAEERSHRGLPGGRSAQGEEKMLGMEMKSFSVVISEKLTAIDDEILFLRSL